MLNVALASKQSLLEEIWEYIDTNPLRWELDCFYTEE